MTIEEKMEIYDDILGSICNEYECGWWEAINGCYATELLERILELGLFDNDYYYWCHQRLKNLQ